MTEKSSLHPRNIHHNSYDFQELIVSVPELKHYVFKNDYDTLTINFSLPKAVKLLNKALLLKAYFPQRIKLILSCVPRLLAILFASFL